MKKVYIDNRIVEKIKEKKITQIILNEKLNNRDLICLNDDIDVEITSTSIYKNIEECFKIIPMDLFGISSIEQAKQDYSNYEKIYAYRVKYDSEDIEEILDKKLLDLIDAASLSKNNIGHSNTNVYEVKLKNNTNAILKVQKLSNRNDLYDEYERIKWLQGKCNVPKIYYYNELDGIKYLLMQKINGVPSYKLDNCFFKVGEYLKNIHSIDIKDCYFNQNSVEVLLKKVLNNIDTIIEQVQEIYSNMNKEELISFIKNNVPNDRVLVHGDYSLPNILITENGEIGVIDLGDLSISTKYFDFYYLRKSMIRNKKKDYFEELLKGYGIEELDENYMKWVEIVDMVLF